MKFKVLYKWNVGEMYENSVAWEEGFKKLQAEAPKLHIFSGALGKPE
jgi:hypothetical protein